MSFVKADLLAYMRGHKLAVASTVNSALLPEAAYLGVAVTDELEVVFDTQTNTRKHSNLLVRPNIALTYCGPGEQTLQLEGSAILIAPTDDAGAKYREVYYRVWPDGRDRVNWTGLVYWAVKPYWARYSDYGNGPLIEEFRWER